MELRDAYVVLELPVYAARAEVKQAYRDLMKVWHPDRHAHDPPLAKRAEEKLKRITVAYGAIESAGFPSSGSPKGDPAPPREAPPRESTPPRERPRASQPPPRESAPPRAESPPRDSEPVRAPDPVVGGKTSVGWLAWIAGYIAAYALVRSGGPDALAGLQVLLLPVGIALVLALVIRKVIMRPVRSGYAWPRQKKASAKIKGRHVLFSIVPPLAVWLVSFAYFASENDPMPMAAQSASVLAILAAVVVGCVWSWLS